MRPRHTIPLAFALATLFATAAGAQETASPLEALRAQFEAIAAAETLDEVVEYVPAHVRPRVATMTPEQKAAGLEEWKGDVARLRPVDGREADGRGVVLLESDDGVRILSMSREEGRWTVVGEEGLQLAVPGARGDFSASGAVEAELQGGVVSQTWIDGVPILSIEDALGQRISEDDRPTLWLTVPDCPTVGTHPLSARDENGGVVSRYAHPRGEGGTWTFDDNPEGELHVASVEDGRWDATFEFRADDSSTGESVGVSIEGSIRGARASCGDEEVGR